MRFFSLLIGVLIFCTSHAQDSTVTIPNNVARYYLEQNDRAKLLAEQVVIKDSQITNLGKQLITKDLFISTYKTDSIAYNSIITTDEEHIEFLNSELEAANKEARKQKRMKILALVGIGIVAILGTL
jgi:hypothetical protein